MSTSSPPPGAADEPEPNLVELRRWIAWRTVDLGPGPGVAVTASRQVIGGQVSELGGWAFCETTGAAAATLRLWDGAVTTGALLLPVTLASNESTRDFVTGHGIAVQTGIIAVEIIAGSVSGVLYWR